MCFVVGGNEECINRLSVTAVELQSSAPPYFVLFMFTNIVNYFHIITVQLTGNVAGTRTTRHASTRETREGAGSPRGIVSKTKTTRELNYSQFIREASLKGPGTIMIQLIYKIHITEHSDKQLQHICTLY